MQILMARQLASAFALLFLLQAKAQAPATEAQLKAVFLYNFTQFTQWPASAFESPDEPFVIGLVGDNSIKNHLTEVISGERVQGRKIIVKHFDSASEIGSCHMLFISSKAKAEAKSALEKKKGSPVLTVSDIDGFGNQGGMIRIYRRNDRMHMQINHDRIKSENIAISSKLLKLAQIVKTK